MYKLPITDELDETKRQLMEKLILLTVLGYENSGKSTLCSTKGAKARGKQDEAKRP